MSDTTLQILKRRAPGFIPQIVVVLGSGWGGLADFVQGATRISYAELPGFPDAKVAGHSGELIIGTLGAHSVAVLSGRKHGYETGAVDAMRLPLEVMCAWGCRVLVQTNASGSVRSDLPPLSLVGLCDHINLPQRSPLVGLPGVQRFVDMAGAYDPGLLAQAQRLASLQGKTLHQGVYAWAFGPQFETPAEIRMLARLGADVVGMSTVPETILARYLGLRVLAFSLVTNMGAGLSPEHLSHAHTLHQAADSGATNSALLAHIIGNLELN